MTVKELKDYLSSLHEDSQVFLESTDSTYVRCLELRDLEPGFWLDNDHCYTDGYIASYENDEEEDKLREAKKNGKRALVIITY